MSCPACEASLTSKWHPMVYAACNGCTTRSVARATPAAQARYVEKLDPDRREAFEAALRAEIARQKAM